MPIGRRLRFSVLALMMLVASAAALFGWAAAERRRRIEALAIEYRQHADRVRWAQRMQDLGYLPPAQLATEQKDFEEVRSRLARLGAPPE